MSKISFSLSGDYGAPSVEVELTVHDYTFGDGRQSAEQLAFMQHISGEVDCVIRNCLRVMHQAYKQAVREKQAAQEAEQIRQMEITELENRLADLKGVPMQATAPAEEGQ